MLLLDYFINLPLILNKEDFIVVKDNRKKIFVLDSSAILHDHNTIDNFHEHDVAIPISVLEELDTFKKGNGTINFIARDFVRYIDKKSGNHTLNEWIPLNGNKEKGRFKVILDEHSQTNAREIFGVEKADHRILDAALHLKETMSDKHVILVSKDINLRVKAKSLQLEAEDYESDKVKNIDELYNGRSFLDDVDKKIIEKLYTEGSCDPEDIPDFEPINNHYLVLRNESSSALCFYNPETKKVEPIGKQMAFGVKPRNSEQTFAMHAILNSNVKLISLQGVAGTGKTLLALAGSLEQRRNFRQIYLARPVVPLGNKDIGYLPGDVKSKLNPYMEPLWDNLKFIQNQYDMKDKEYKQITEMLDKEKLMITPLAYIRGRSISNILFIVDEAQNLTPHEIKTIISRAGENTKIIFTGDIYQIDTPYLDSRSNGLSYLIDKMKGQELYAHIALKKGERSELANLANKYL